MSCVATSARGSSSCFFFSATSRAARKRRERCWFLARSATPSAFR